MERGLKLFNSKIGNYKYLSEEDIIHLYRVYVNDETQWEAFHDEMKEVYFLTKSYANKLDNHERLYIDDRR